MLYHVGIKSLHSLQMLHRHVVSIFSDADLFTFPKTTNINISDKDVVF